MKLKIEIIQRTELHEEVDGEWWTGDEENKGKEMTLPEGINEVKNWLDESGYTKDRQGEYFVREWGLDYGETEYIVILTDEETGDTFEF